MSDRPAGQSEGERRCPKCLGDGVLGVWPRRVVDCDKCEGRGFLAAAVPPVSIGYREGFDAYHAGVGLNDNPMKRHPSIWAEGWIDAKRADEAPVSVEGEWRCPKCNRRNAATEATCYLCGDASPRPVSVEGGRCQHIEGEGKRCTEQANHGGPHTFMWGAVSVEGEDEGGWRAAANDFQRAMFDERRAVEAANHLIDRLKDVIDAKPVRDLDEAVSAYYAARTTAASPSSPTGPDEDEIERAARAIFRADAGWPDFMWAQVKNERKDQCRAMARAALTAARGSDSDDD